MSEFSWPLNPNSCFNIKNMTIISLLCYSEYKYCPDSLRTEYLSGYSKNYHFSFIHLLEKYSSEMLFLAGMIENLLN